MNRVGALLLTSALMSSPATGDDAAAFNTALGKAATGAILADAYLIACAGEVPDLRQAQQDAVAGWAHRVDLAGYRRLLEVAIANAPGLADELSDNTQRAQGIVDEDVARDAAP